MSSHNPADFCGMFRNACSQLPLAVALAGVSLVSVVVSPVAHAEDRGDSTSGTVAASSSAEASNDERPVADVASAVSGRVIRLGSGGEKDLPVKLFSKADGKVTALGETKTNAAGTFSVMAKSQVKSSDEVYAAVKLGDDVDTVTGTVGADTLGDQAKSVEGYKIFKINARLNDNASLSSTIVVAKKGDNQDELKKQLESMTKDGQIPIEGKAVATFDVQGKDGYDVTGKTWSFTITNLKSDNGKNEPGDKVYYESGDINTTSFSLSYYALVAAGMKTGESYAIEINAPEGAYASAMDSETTKNIDLGKDFKGNASLDSAKDSNGKLLAAPFKIDYSQSQVIWSNKIYFAANPTPTTVKATQTKDGGTTTVDLGVTGTVDLGTVTAGMVTGSPVTLYPSGSAGAGGYTVSTDQMSEPTSSANGAGSGSGLSALDLARLASSLSNSGSGSASSGSASGGSTSQSGSGTSSSGNSYSGASSRDDNTYSYNAPESSASSSASTTASDDGSSSRTGALVNNGFSNNSVGRSLTTQRVDGGTSLSGVSGTKGYVVDTGGEVEHKSFFSKLKQSIKNVFS